MWAGAVKVALGNQGRTSQGAICVGGRSQSGAGWARRGSKPYKGVTAQGSGFGVLASLSLPLEKASLGDTAKIQKPMAPQPPRASSPSPTRAGFARTTASLMEANAPQGPPKGCMDPSAFDFKASEGEKLRTLEVTHP